MDKPRSFRWLTEILENPEVLEPPKRIVPKLAWKERVTLLAGREKGGKSTLASAAAAAVSAGKTFLGEPCDPGNVLIISLEEHENDYVPRLVDFGGDPDRIGVVEEADPGMTLIDTIWAAAEYATPSLIIWDTLGKFANIHTGKKLDPNDSQGWTEVLTQITEVARVHGATLLIHHSRKSDGAYRDSTAIGANVDVILEMFGKGKGPRTIRGVGRGKTFEDDEIRISLEGNAFRLVETEVQLQKRVTKFVGQNVWCSWQDLRNGVEARDVDIQRARDALLKSGEMVNVGSKTAHKYALAAVPA